MITVLNIIISGLIMGGIYALISMGLSLQYGVARILNVTHGEFIMMAAFLTWVMVSTAGINPLLALVICCPVTFLVGYLLHITIFRWLKRFSIVTAVFESNAMLLCFGLMFIMSNAAMQIWGSNTEGINSCRLQSISRNNNSGQPTWRPCYSVGGQLPVLSLPGPFKNG
jgi:branched-chain amino acid transport system permease protein